MVYYILLIVLNLFTMEVQRHILKGDDHSAFLEQQKKDWAKEREEERAKEVDVMIDPETGIKIEVDPEGVREDETEIV